MRKYFAFIILCHVVVFSQSCVDAAPLKSSMQDQVGVEVTVYNSNLGLIKDTRRIQLAKGSGELRFQDVASQINPVTVSAKSMNHPDQFAILEQNYEYDLIDYDKLLDKYVGKALKIERWNQYQDRKETVDAVLISNNSGQVYRIDDQIYLGHDGIKILPDLPDNLIDKPTLTWLYESGTDDSHVLELSYLTSGINWNADYVLILDASDTQADLAGWVTIENQSGTTYTDAKLKLVAGDVNRVQGPVYAEADHGRYQMRAMAMSQPQFTEQTFFEYHIYDLQRSTTLKNYQTKQIRFTEAFGVSTAKQFMVKGASSHFYRRHQGGSTKTPVEVRLKFKNSEANRLGIPLPQGIVRLYKEDQQQSLQFIGEDRISHTPKDEEIDLRIGEAFDLVAERKQISFRQLTAKLYESSWEILLKNHKEEAVTVIVEEPLSGSWQVTESSHEYTKKDAFTIRFEVAVPKDGEVTVSYKVRVGI